MSTIRHTLTSDAWTKISTGSGVKRVRKASGGHVLLHIGKSAPALDSPHYFTMEPNEHFEVAGETLFARTAEGSAEVVVIG